jgi:hypothetical protein
MSKQDQLITIMILLLIVIHAAIGIAGYITGRLLFFITLLNLLAGLSIIIYWIQKQVRISRHFFELREMFVLSLELILIGCAIYFISKNPAASFFKVFQYTFFGVHLLLLILGLIFMLTFKMNKLM